MTSDRQRAANRANSRRSTGPRSPEGKAIVRFNGLRHGLLARAAVVLPGEDLNAFEDLRNNVFADLAPDGPVETFFTDRVVDTMWRLQRLGRVETALFHWRAHKLRADHLAAQLRSLDVFLLEMSGLAVNKAAEEALARAVKECNRDEVILGSAFDADAKDGDTFGKLSRYEAGLERTLFRSLYELRYLQEQRRQRNAPPVLNAETDQRETPDP